MPDAKEQPQPAQSAHSGTEERGLMKWIKGLRRTAPVESVLSNIAAEDPANDFITNHERLLLSNILNLRDRRVSDIMVPRADIVAVEIGITPQELLSLLSQKQYSRIPVFRETLDDVVGTIHLKDVVSALARGEEINIKNMITDIPIVSPAMTILNLLLKMRQSSRHMALVVDEYGGIDGLVTIGNVIESIVGEIEDEHTGDEAPKVVKRDDGSVLVDARLPIDEFENQFGYILSDEERRNSETLSGLVYSMTGRIPARGEVLTHPTGMIFEVLDAGPRRINLMRIQNIPSSPPAE